MVTCFNCGGIDYHRVECPLSGTQTLNQLMEKVRKLEIQVEKNRSNVAILEDDLSELQ